MKVTHNFLFLFAPLLFGCGIVPSVGPDYERPDMKLSQDWENNTNASAAQPTEEEFVRWWSKFQDPQLDALIKQAVTANKDLLVAESRVRESSEQRDIAFSSFFPQISLGGNADRRQASRNSLQGRQIAAIGGTSPSSPTTPTAPRRSLIYDTFAGTATASWEIDIFGGLRRQYEAADALYEATEEQLHDTLVRLVAEVATNYFEVRAVEKRLAIAQQNVESQAQSLRIIQDRETAGLVSALDTAQARTQLEETKATIPALEAQLVGSRARLALVLGIMPAELTAFLPKQQILPDQPIAPNLPEVILSGVPADILRNRPDIRVAERNLAAQTAQIGIAMADLFPKFNLTGDYGLQSVLSGDFFDSASRAWHVGAGVSLPIFTAGRLTSQLRAQNEQAAQATSLYEKAVLQALTEAESSLASFSKERERKNILAAANHSALEALRFSQEQYRAGLIDLLRVIEAQRGAFSTGDALAVSEQRVAANFVSTYKALGFGWQRPQDPSEATTPPAPS